MGSEKATFSVRSVIDAIESAQDDSWWYANVQTGKLDCHYDALGFGANSEYDEFAFEGEEWLSLPDKRERDDWGTMRDYAFALGGAAGNELLDAIHGKGAFRAFRNCIERMGALQSWYAFKDEHVYQLAVEWLEEHGCPYVDDRPEQWKRDWHALLPETLRMRLTLSVLDYKLSVCKFAELPPQVLQESFIFAACAEGEVSVVCETEKVPNGTLAREDGWRALMVEGPLDFALVGVLAKISSALADAGVPLFAVSTFDTDYVLVKEDDLRTAIAALDDQGCLVYE